MSLYSLRVYKTVFLEDFCRLGCYAAYVGSCLPTDVSGQSLGPILKVKHSKNNVGLQADT